MRAYSARCGPPWAIIEQEVEMATIETVRRREELARAIRARLLAPDSQTEAEELERRLRELMSILVQRDQDQTIER
jgi:pantothenate synthetase